MRFNCIYKVQVILHQCSLEQTLISHESYMFIFRRKTFQFVINSNLSFDNWVFFVFLIVTDISEIQSHPFKLSGYFVLGRDELCWSLTDDGGTNRSLSNAFFIIFNLCADSCDPDFFFASWKEDFFLFQMTFLIVSY